MNNLDKDFRKERARIKKEYMTHLLAELIWLDFCYSNKEYNNTTGNDIWKSLINDNYSEKEKSEIIKNASLLLEIDYNAEVIDFENNIVKNKT